MTPYPLSDHFDGQRFFNPGVDGDKSLGDLLRWVLANQRQRWPKRLINPPRPRPAIRAEPDTIITTYVGQSTFLVQVPGCNILTDPIFSEHASPVPGAGPRRVRPPALKLDDLPPIGLVLVSHDHYDHLDLPSLRTIQERWRPKIVTGLGVGAYLRRKGISDAVELDWWERFEHGAGLRTHFVPAQHWSRRGMFDRRKTLWGGHLVESSAGTVLFAGDTGYGPHFSAIRKRLGSPDIALLPIGAYEPRWFMMSQHMDPDDAVRAHLDLGAGLSIGMHFATFQLTDEGIHAPVEALETARTNERIAAEEFIAPDFGIPIRWRQTARSARPVELPAAGTQVSAEQIGAFP
jgi:L-ascorbate metabolism protein UlaG (beta-lactamase superfamily)